MKKNTWINNRFKTYSPLIVCYYHLTVGRLISMDKFSVTFTHEKNVRGCVWFRNWGLKNRNSCLSFVDIEKIRQTFITGYMNKKKISYYHKTGIWSIKIMFVILHKHRNRGGDRGRWLSLSHHYFENLNKTITSNFFGLSRLLIRLAISSPTLNFLLTPLY